MSKFKFDKLVVLHLYNYIKPTGECDPLAQVEKICNVIKLSTCMRVVLVLNTDGFSDEAQAKAYGSLKNYIERRDIYSASITFQRLDGDKAYEFLLYWMIGGLNPKKTFNDSRIIGDVRAIWNKMFISPSPRNKALVTMYNEFFYSLFTDSTKLHKLIDQLNMMEAGEKTTKLYGACINCTWTRYNGFLKCLQDFEYSHFITDNYLVELKISLESMKQTIGRKATYSSTGEVTFFQSNYPVSENKLSGINKRLGTISDLLQLINKLNEDKIDKKDESEEVIVNEKDKEKKVSVGGMTQEIIDLKPIAYPTLS